MSIQEAITAERAANAALDGQLSEERTPYIKDRLRFARSLLNDAESILRLAEKSTFGNQAAMMRAGAQDMLGMATTTRKNIQETVNKYGGPASVVEFG